MFVFDIYSFVSIWLIIHSSARLRHQHPSPNLRDALGYGRRDSKYHHCPQGSTRRVEQHTAGVF